MPGEAAAKVVQTKEPQHKDDFEEWLARIICFAFSVTVTGDDECKDQKMKPPLPRTLSAVPQTLHTRLEIAKAIRTLAGPDEDELLRRRRAEIAAIRRDLEVLSRDLHKAFEAAATLAKAELRAALKKYNADQPRVSAGNPDGGQWTTGDGGSGSPSNSSTLNGSAGLRITQGSDWRLLPINLIDEKEPNGPGHAIRKHVGKSQAELIQELQQDSFQVGTTEFVRAREGSFDSISSANGLVNRTLQQNSGEVDLVASGQLQRKYIQFDFWLYHGI